MQHGREHGSLILGKPPISSWTITRYICHKFAVHSSFGSLYQCGKKNKEDKNETKQSTQDDREYLHNTDISVTACQTFGHKGIR